MRLLTKTGNIIVIAFATILIYACILIFNENTNWLKDTLDFTTGIGVIASLVLNIKALNFSYKKHSLQKEYEMKKLTYEQVNHIYSERFIKNLLLLESFYKANEQSFTTRNFVKLNSAYKNSNCLEALNSNFFYYNQICSGIRDEVLSFDIAKNTVGIFITEDYDRYWQFMKFNYVIQGVPLPYADIEEFVNRFKSESLVYPMFKKNEE